LLPRPIFEPTGFSAALSDCGMNCFNNRWQIVAKFPRRFWYGVLEADGMVLLLLGLIEPRG
jgi:hypothetical protein